MATEIRKFVDQAGVSTLWAAVAAEVAKVDKKAVDNAAAIAINSGDIATMKGQIEALEKGTYDDSAVRELIQANADAIADNVEALALLNGEVDVVGSVKHTATEIAAAKVAEIVANADADFDTLKEIADWILNDTTGAADMANDIKALQTLVGDEAIATQIANAIAAEGLDKYALAADLNGVADRVKALEDAGYQNADQVGSAIDAKIAALKLAETYEVKGAAATAETNAKAYADSLAVNYEVAGAAAQALNDAKAYVDGIAANHEAKGAAAQALVDAKAYTDAEFAKIQPLTAAEIEAAIAAAAGK